MKFNNAVKKMDFSSQYFHLVPKGSKKSCCTNQLLSVLWAPMHMLFRSRFEQIYWVQFLVKITLGCQWEPINLTKIFWRKNPSFLLHYWSPNFRWPVNRLVYCTQVYHVSVCLVYTLGASVCVYATLKKTPHYTLLELCDASTVNRLLHH